MDDIPVELLHEMAFDRPTYLALLTIKRFANSLTPSMRCDYMIRFGYCVEITRNEIRWTRNGELHRTDGPALIRVNGTQAWYIDYKLHRTDGPAIIFADGMLVWYINGKRHRTDGPARIDVDGTQEWYINGKRHHTDGPAIIDADGTRYWYIDGESMTEQEFNSLKS